MSTCPLAHFLMSQGVISGIHRGLPLQRGAVLLQEWCFAGGRAMLWWLYGFAVMLIELFYYVDRAILLWWRSYAMMALGLCYDACRAMLLPLWSYALQVLERCFMGAIDRYSPLPLFRLLQGQTRESAPTVILFPSKRKEALGANPMPLRLSE